MSCLGFEGLWNRHVCLLDVVTAEMAACRARGSFCRGPGGHAAPQIRLRGDVTERCRSWSFEHITEDTLRVFRAAAVGVRVADPVAFGSGYETLGPTGEGKFQASFTQVE